MVTRRRAAPLLMVSLLVALAAGSAACAAVLGFDRLSEEAASEAGANEASTEAGTETGAPEAGPGCTALGLPDRPAPSGAGDAGPEAVHMAVKLFDFGIEQTTQPSGFNLDRACSPTVATSTCATKIDEQTFAKYGKDHDDKGLDNAGFGLLGYLAYLGSAFSPKEINNRLQAGEFGVVLRLANWNGTNDDDDVIVELFPAIGVWNVPDGGGAPTSGGTPTFLPGDQWMRDRRFQNVVDASRIKSANAWVTGGRLVASFQSVTLPVTVPDDKKPFDIVIQEGFLSGMLVVDGTSWRIEGGVIGGRWRTADMLAQARTIYVKDTVGLQNAVLCEPGLASQVYAAVKKEVCDARDIRGTSRDDGKSLPCDAFSTGLRLDTYAVAAPGPFADLPAVAARCEADGSIPAGDDCAPAAP